VGEAAARHFWPGENPVGKFLSSANGTMVVVGVARDIKSTSLVDGLSESFVYLPLQQQYAANLTSNLTIVTRRRIDPPLADSIRRLVASVNPNLMIVTSRSLDDSLALGLVPQSVAASVSLSLGLFGLLLAALGIYGVTAFAVIQRTREFGIRIALGARGADIARMIVRHGLLLSVAGCAIGVGLAAAAGQVLGGFLFGVPPLDPVLFAGASALASLVGLAACLGPARRATSVDALIALRHE
jgi:ABC-type antimicrobial peptide transport system permease subunit